jgi:uncharacterized protein (TIGR03545 family)
MRKNFVFFILVPVIVLLAVVYFFIDGWVESGLESAGEALVGARVEIDRVHLSLFPLGLRWDRMQVANPNDPWKNVFETGVVAFAMDPGQLLRSKVIIETMEVNELILGTRRTTDGSLPRHTTAAGEPASSFFTGMARQALERTIEPTPVFNLENLRRGFNPDSLVRSLDLATLRHLDTIKAGVAATSRQWQNTLADIETTKTRLRDLETRVRAIDPGGLNSVDRIVAAIGTVENGISTVNDARKTFETRKASITGDVQRLAGSVRQVDGIVKDDFRRLMMLARLPDLNTAGISRLLVGQEIVQRALTYLSWVDFARSNIKRYTPAPAFEKPVRFRGQDIRFPVERHYPKLWIKNILVSGGTGQKSDDDFVRASGEVHHVTDDQTVTGQPMTVALKGTEGGGRSFSLSALFDRRKEIPFDEYTATLGGVPLSEFRLGKSDFLPARIVNARMTSGVTIAVPGNRFDARATFELKGFTVAFDGESRNLVERLVREVLQGITGFDAGLRIWNTGGGIDLAITTNLDDELAARVKAVLGAELTKLQNELRSRLDAIVEQKRVEVERLVAGKKAELEKTLQTYETLINEKTAFMEAKKKELTDKLEKEKKGKVDDLLKKLIK